MKKLITMCLACMVLIIGTCIAIDRNDVKASSGNDTYETATKLKNNTTITSSLEGKDDVDWYVYEVNDSTGVEWIEFKALENSFSVQVYIDDDGIPTDRIFNGFDEHTYKSNEFSLSKGTILYVSVGGPWIGNANGVEYNLTMCTSKEPVTGCEWAIEDDGNYENANIITSSKNLCGVTNPNDDVDWYKYIVKNDKPFKFKFQSTKADAEDFQFYVYEGDDGIPSEQIFGKYRLKAAETEEFTYPKGTVIYIKVNAYSNVTSGVRYKLSVTDTAKNSAENTTSEDTAVISILAGTNIVVGKADPGAKVSVKYGKKTYTSTADANGYYRVKTAKLKKGKKVTIWQTVDKKDSDKVTVKVVEKY